MDELVKSPTFEELACKVGAWSLENFGENISGMKAAVQDGVRFYKVIPVQTGSFCPLLGIAEEFGEFSQAIAMRDQKEIEDAIGDQVIYLCDYITREGLEVPDYHRGCTLSIPASLSYRQCCEIGIGWLMHANLKRIQNIRGMNIREKFVEKAQQGIDLFYFGLFHMSLNKTRNHPLAHGGRVFDAVVAKRNWKKNSADGKTECKNDIDHIGRCHNCINYKGGCDAFLAAHGEPVYLGERMETLPETKSMQTTKEIMGNTEDYDINNPAKYGN